MLRRSCSCSKYLLTLCLAVGAFGSGCQSEAINPNLDPAEELPGDAGATLPGDDAGTASDAGSTTDAGTTATPDFALSLPTRVIIRPDGTATLRVEIDRAEGFAAPIELQVVGLPAEVSAPAVTVPPAASSADVLLGASAQLVPGQRVTASVVAVGAGVARTASFTLATVGLPGTLDSSFHGDGLVSLDLGADGFSGDAVALRPDGRILIAARNLVTKERYLVQLSPQGALDTSFGDQGKVKLPGTATNSCALEVLEDGSALVMSGGSGLVVSLSRVLAGGVIDPTYEAGSVFQGSCARGGLLRLSGGRVLLAGYDANLLLLSMRDALTGAPVSSFGSGGLKNVDMGAKVWTGALLADGDGALLAGTVLKPVGMLPVLIRLDAEGALDQSFGTDGLAYLGGGQIMGIDVERAQDGSLMGFSHGSPQAAFVEGRLGDGGTPEPAPGVLKLEALVPSEAIVRPDGSFDLVGYNALGKCVVAHLDASGALDPAFGQGGRAEIAFGPSSMCFGIARDELSLIVVGVAGSPTTDISLARVWQ